MAVATQRPDPSGEKIYRWWDSGEFWGYKVGCTVYETGLLVAYLPVGFPGGRTIIRQFESSDLALGYAQAIQTAIEGVMDELEATTHWRDGPATREVLGV